MTTFGNRFALMKCAKFYKFLAALRQHGSARSVLLVVSCDWPASKDKRKVFLELIILCVQIINVYKMSDY